MVEIRRHSKIREIGLVNVLALSYVITIVSWEFGAVLMSGCLVVVEVMVPMSSRIELLFIYFDHYILICTSTIYSNPNLLCSFYFCFFFKFCQNEVAIQWDYFMFFYSICV